MVTGRANPAICTSPGTDGFRGIESGGFSGKVRAGTPLARSAQRRPLAGAKGESQHSASKQHPLCVQCEKRRSLHGSARRKGSSRRRVCEGVTSERYCAKRLRYVADGVPTGALEACELGARPWRCGLPCMQCETRCLASRICMQTQTPLCSSIDRSWSLPYIHDTTRGQSPDPWESLVQ